MNPNLDWREELYQLLTGHLSEVPFDEGIREMADIGAHDRETHDNSLAAIQSAYDAGLSGDHTVVDVINRGNTRYVADVSSATAFLKALRDTYLSAYERELKRRDPGR
jgi:hypothetical protein